MRKIWLGHELGASNFQVMFGKNWWNRIKGPLLEAILPEQYYQVPRDGVLVWDELGTRTFNADVARFFGAASIEEARTHSWWRLFWEIGKLLYRDDMGMVRAFALGKISRKEERPVAVDPQLLFRFPANGGEGE